MEQRGLNQRSLHRCARYFGAMEEGINGAKGGLNEELKECIQAPWLLSCRKRMRTASRSIGGLGAKGWY